MKKLIFALVVIAALATSAFASAAALQVDGGVLQAGTDTELRCDFDGVSVNAYGLNTLPGDYEGVEYIWVTGVDPACAGAKLFARAALANGTFLTSSGTAVGYTNVIVQNPEPAGGAGTEDDGYKLYLQNGQPGPLGWPKAEDVVQIKIWIEGNPAP